LKVKKIGNSSLTFYIEIHPEDEDNCLATGEVIWVNSDQKSHKSCPLSDTIKDKINLLEKYY
jgi:acyl-CoA thioester hydrolase